MVRSSTYFQRSDFNVFRSFTITKNKIGPNLVPWGTPALTCAHSEIDSPSLTLYLRLDKKSHNLGYLLCLVPEAVSALMKNRAYAERKLCDSKFIYVVFPRYYSLIFIITMQTYKELKEK